MSNPTTSERRKLAFRFFNEVGIIHQLSSALFNRKLPEGLHVSHFAVLNHMIRLGDGETPLALASAFQVTKGTMTHTLDALSRRGLIRTEPNQRDGRSKLIFLTAEGRTFHESALASLEPAYALMEEKLDLAKLSTILPVLESVRKILDDNRDI